jgi:hypothetical protein
MVTLHIGIMDIIPLTTDTILLIMDITIDRLTNIEEVVLLETLEIPTKEVLETK